MNKIVILHLLGNFISHLLASLYSAPELDEHGTTITFHSKSDPKHVFTVTITESFEG